MWIRCTFAIFALLLSACGKMLEGPKMSDVHAGLAVPSPELSRLFFLRPGEKAFGWSARIDIDGDRVVNLPLSGCYYQDVVPGTHSLYLDIPADMGSHEMTVDMAPQSSRYYKVWPRRSRELSSIFGFLGATVNYLASDSKNDGSLEFVELSREEAVPLFSECVFFNEMPQVASDEYK